MINLVKVILKAFSLCKVRNYKNATLIVVDSYHS